MNNKMIMSPWLKKLLQKCFLFFIMLQIIKNLNKQYLKKMRNRYRLKKQVKTATDYHKFDQNRSKHLQKSSSAQQLFFQQSKNNLTFITCNIKVPKVALFANIQIYRWRNKTQFPIVRTLSINLYQNQNMVSEYVQLTVSNQYCPLKLADIYQIPLRLSLYLLREALIGFQRLHNKFGLFEVQSSMIYINQKGSCKVWLNEDYRVNSPVKILLLQSTIVEKIISSIQSHTEFSEASNKIFNILKRCESFLQSLTTLRRIIQAQKFILPLKFNFFRIETPKKYQAQLIINKLNPNSSLCLSKRSSVKKINYFKSPEPSLFNSRGSRQKKQNHKSILNFNDNLSQSKQTRSTVNRSQSQIRLSRLPKLLLYSKNIFEFMSQNNSLYASPRRFTGQVKKSNLSPKKLTNMLTQYIKKKSYLEQKNASRNSITPGMRKVLGEEKEQAIDYKINSFKHKTSLVSIYESFQDQVSENWETIEKIKNNQQLNVLVNQFKIPKDFI